MRVFLGYILVLLLCIAFASFLSYLAFFGFWIGARWFHSVPTARALDTAGGFLLIPVRLVLYCFGGKADQTMPVSDPVMYSMANGAFLGALVYAGIRPFLFRNAERDGEKTSV